VDLEPSRQLAHGGSGFVGSDQVLNLVSSELADDAAVWTVSDLAAAVVPRQLIYPFSPIRVVGVASQKLQACVRVLP
jgi:hypothetical protein